MNLSEELTPILTNIETAIIEYDLFEKGKPGYGNEALRASLKILMHIVMDHMYSLQEDENMELEDRLNMAKMAGQELRQFIKRYTNIDTHNLYKNDEIVG